MIRIAEFYLMFQRFSDDGLAICESGYRSALASSLLLRAGVPVVSVINGTAAYRALAVPTST
jgi:rhodanese-related sulfurtransferase